jgi:peptide/nickel transport system substrate-binding protein
MKLKKIVLMLLTIVIVASMVAACAPTTPITEAPAEEAEEAEEAPSAPADDGTPLAITGDDMQGVSPGKYPTQYELDEFEAAAGGTMVFTGRSTFDPMLTAIFGDFPADVNERLPEEPLVVVPYYEIGTYGGELQGLSLGPESGNSEYMSWRHNNFLRYSEDLKTIVPNVVKDYTYNDDLTEFTFTLRKGHKWSDGEPFTVDDVIFWYEDIIMNEELTPTVPNVWVFGGGPIKIEKVDDVTFVVKTEATAAGFLHWLARTWITPAAPKHYLESKHIKYNPDINEEAIEEGFASWVEYFFTWHGDWNDSVHRYGVPRLEAWLLVEETTEYQLMVANPYYFKVDTAGQQLPYADRSRESYSQDSQVLELKIINGEVDEKAQSLSFASVPVFKSHEEDGNYKVNLVKPVSDGSTVAFNCTHKDPVLREIFSTKEFSYAMSIALDRSEFNKVRCFGECEEINTGVPIHPTASFAKDEWYNFMIEYDPDGANKLLDEIGLDKKDAEGWRLRPDGKRLIIFSNYTIQSSSSETMNLVKSYWEAVGVKTEIKEVDTEQYRALVSGNDHDVASFTSGTTLEQSFLADQYRFYPPFGDEVLEPICGMEYKEWLVSDGANGTEPPEDMKRLYELTQEFKTLLPGTPEYVKVGQEIGDIHMINKWVIGIIGPAPATMIVHNRLGNFMPSLITCFEIFREYPYRPDQWYIKE